MYIRVSIVVMDSSSKIVYVLTLKWTDAVDSKSGIETYKYVEADTRACVGWLVL